MVRSVMGRTVVNLEANGNLQSCIAALANLAETGPGAPAPVTHLQRLQWLPRW